MVEGGGDHWWVWLRGGGRWGGVEVMGELEVVGGGGYREACFYARGGGGGGVV